MVVRGMASSPASMMASPPEWNHGKLKREYITTNGHNLASENQLGIHFSWRTDSTVVYTTEKVTGRFGGLGIDDTAGRGPVRVNLKVGCIVKDSLQSVSPIFLR